MRKSYSNRAILSTHLSLENELEYAKNALALNTLIDVPGLIECVENRLADIPDELTDIEEKWKGKLELLCDEIDEVIETLSKPLKTNKDREVLLVKLNKAVKAAKDGSE